MAFGGAVLVDMFTKKVFGPNSELPPGPFQNRFSSVPPEFDTPGEGSNYHSK